MRFNDYLVEKKLNKKERQKVEDFEHYAEKIEKECSQILSVYKKTGKVLYRGIPHSDHQRKDFLEMESRKGVRKPKHIDIEVHRYLNKLFKEKFGWKVRDGLAVTPVFHETLRYGDTYIFFPVNRYKFVYSPDIDDLWRHIPTMPIGVKGKEWVKSKHKTWTRKVNKYTDENLEKALQHESEIFFKTRKYYMVKMDPFFYGLMKERWDIDIKKG